MRCGLGSGFRLFAYIAFSTALAAQTVPPKIGFHTNHMPSWPIQVPFDCWRSLNSTLAGSGSKWMSIQTSATTYNFDLVDAAMRDMAAAGKTCTIFTPNGTPSFAALSHGFTTDGTQPKSCKCNDAMGATGCNPPADLNADGSGTNATWKAFISNLAAHIHQNHLANPSTYAEMAYWEAGNEYADNIAQWCGSFQQLARMMQDEKCIIAGTGPGCTGQPINSKAKILTAAIFGDGAAVKYLEAVPKITNGASSAVLADIINTHPYVFGKSRPERVIEQISHFRDVIAKVPATSGKPIFGTEGGWVKSTPTTWAHAVTWLPRFMLALSSTGIGEFSLFGYDFSALNTSTGPGFVDLWAADSSTFCAKPAAPGMFCPVEVGYVQVYRWLQGISFKSVCSGVTSGAGKIWSCDHTSSGAYTEGRFIWFDVQEGTAKYNVPAGFTQIQDIDGKISPVTVGQSLTLTNSPLLLMNSKEVLLPPSQVNVAVH